MAKLFELQDDTELAYKVKKYKCMYDKAYKHLFSFSRKMSITQTKLPCLDFSQFSFLLYITVALLISPIYFL